MNNINENLEPVKEIVQTQNINENQQIEQIEELKIENEGIFNFIINEYLSEQCEKMKKNYMMKNFLENIKILKKISYEIYFEDNNSKEVEYVLKKEGILLKELKDLVLNYSIKVLHGDNLFKIAEKYESKELKEQEKQYYEFVDELYRKLKNLQGFYEFVLRYFKKYENEDILKNREMFEKEFVNKIKKESLKDKEQKDDGNEIEIIEDSANAFLYSEKENDKDWKNLNKVLRETENKLAERNNYCEVFRDCFFNFVKYFYDSSHGTKEIDKYDEEEFNVYAQHNIKKKDMKDWILEIYLEFVLHIHDLKVVIDKQLERISKNIKEKCCYNYNLEKLEYISNVLDQEKEKLMYHFSYLENLMRLINSYNFKESKNKINLREYFNINNEFKDSYNPNSEEAFPIKFKYDMEEIMYFYFYAKENIKKGLEVSYSRIVPGESTMHITYEKTGKTEKRLLIDKKDITKCIAHTYNRIDEIYESKIKPILKKIEPELKDDSYSKKLINLIKVLLRVFLRKEIIILNKYNVIKNAEVEAVEGGYKVKTPGLTAPGRFEKIINPRIFNIAFKIVHFLSGEEDEVWENFNKFILDYLKKNNLYTGNFVEDVSTAIINEFKKIKKNPVKNKNFSSSKYPSILETFENYKGSGNEKYKVNSTVDDVYFNEIFENVESLVDENGVLKDKDKKNFEMKNTSSFLELLYQKLEYIIEYNIHVMKNIALDYLNYFH